MVRPEPVIRAALAKFSSINGKYADEACVLSVMDNVYYYNVMLSDYPKMKRFAFVISTYRKMISRGVTPNFRTLGILRKCFSRINSVDHAFGVMEKILKMEFVPDIATYTNLIKGLINHDRIGDATVLLVKIDKMGCPPNLFTYHCLINGLFKHGKGGMEMRFFADMEAKGIILNVVLYHAVIKGCYKIGEIEVALDVHWKMLRRKP